MATNSYRLGAVVYHPKVRQIWEEFGAWFGEHGLPLDVHYHDTYDEQVRELLDGRIDAAWNTNLAYVQTLERTGGGCRGIAMRDTDRGWTSKLVALTASGFEGLEDLRGGIRHVVGGDSLDGPGTQAAERRGRRAGLAPAAVAHAALAYPGGRLHGGVDRVAVAIGYGVGVGLTGVLVALVLDPRRGGCFACPQNLLLVHAIRGSPTGSRAGERAPPPSCTPGSLR